VGQLVDAQLIAVACQCSYLCALASSFFMSRDGCAAGPVQPVRADLANLHRVRPGHGRGARLRLRQLCVQPGRAARHREAGRVHARALPRALCRATGSCSLHGKGCKLSEAYMCGSRRLQPLLRVCLGLRMRRGLVCNLQMSALHASAQKLSGVLQGGDGKLILIRCPTL